jgi:hypothetical protein
MQWCKKHLPLALITIALSLAALRCSDDTVTPPKKDSGKPIVDARKDTTAQWPDIYIKKDQKQTIWPDLKAPADTKPWPQPDGYAGGNFGCQADSDCFGQKCCATPWGVKLCAPSCTP